MKKINKLLLCLALLLSLIFAACATAPKPVSTVSPVELKCISTCELMSSCKRPEYSEHQKLTCKAECLQVPPVFRAAVAECARKALPGRCNWGEMNSCIKKRLGH